MKKVLLTMALVILLSAPSRDGRVAAADAKAPAAAPALLPAPAPAVPAPPASAPVVASPAPVVIYPTVVEVPGASCPGCVKTKKICVTEEKPATKIVYSSHTQDYCVKCCLMRYFVKVPAGEGCDGCQSCESGVCGKPRTRHVLVVKPVEICTKPCVVREVIDDSCPRSKKCSAPCGGCACGPATHAMIGTPITTSTLPIGTGAAPTPEVIPTSPKKP
jgi:hypothetical protein